MAEWPTRDLLAHRAATTPERTALIDADADAGDGDASVEWTYADFDRRVDRTAAALEDEGVVDDRLGVCMDTRPAFATVFFAAMRLGLTVVPLNVRETTDELAAKVERTELEAVICESETESTALELAASTDGRRLPVLSVDEPESGSDADTETDTDVQFLEATAGGDSGSPSVDPVPLERDDTQLLLFTSGTSGEPKIVRLTVGNLVASATASAFRLGVDRNDRWLCCLPMYHMGGLAPIVRSTLYGTTVVIQREFDARETARVMDEYDITGVSLVPTMCKRLLDADWEPPESLRFVLLGGAPASSELLERCLEAGVPVHPTYGMTETASQVATATPADVREHEGTVGQPLVNTDVTIIDEDGDPVPSDEPGELVVSGPTVTPGYLDSDRTDEAFGDRGLHTGDVGYRDADGRLRILNRRSDRIVTGGENVDPGEVVAILREHPAVEDAAVVGLEDPEWSERVAALVVPAADAEVESNVDSLLAHCDEHLAGFKKPKMIAFADSLPRTASGTVDREAVRDRLLEDGIDVDDR
ncbi:o-succinylbenzoate--CoA ligase [Halopiger xanaduensis]|uniref:O-succinylbenzoate-CoA ligase n=1 Tax=Halopiger xanaduensis (strain DSM 18323 / JCM 14033 / SH-6) TaxID=797210 RepID=F8D810_HALXS|nr:o-succinylbenzoate--CoA ligase [Halopiger xanaduensis]AEH37902.1 O-succinylbenzoate-CoA ligase [Halopiger xanaduensis SH-6]